VQFDLLAEACERQLRARLTWPRQAGGGPAASTRLLGMTRTHLFVSWPSGLASGSSDAGALVEAYFRLRGNWFAFRTKTCGPETWTCPDCGELEAWKLALPTCIERKQQRDHFRVPVTDLGNIAARFTSVDDPASSFTGNLTDVSAGGLAGVAPIDVAERAEPGALFWAEFSLPDNPIAFEFVVRVVRKQPMESQRTVVLGCKFCPGEDPSVFCRQMYLLERFVAERERVRLGRLNALRGGN
jgi:hypothetical protein